MALSTKTIQDSINWAKRMSFNRNPVIGNSLEPALTSAAMVMQAILSPPFEWWWNSQETVFTCNTTPKAATSTAAVVASNVLTVTAANTFTVGQALMISAFLGTLKPLNGQIIQILTATSSTFTAAVVFPNNTDTVGTFTAITTQDYLLSLSNFSHIKHASVNDLDANNPKWYELKVQNNLALESSLSRPMFIGPNYEDGSGNVSFRVFPAPDKAYPISIQAQLAAPAVTSVNQTWSPLPDFMQYVYQWGFLALMWMFADDPRTQYAEAKFKAALLGRAEGLTEEEKNIFLNNWESLKEFYALKMQQGIQARGA
jgi:hypothetical protein